MQKTQRSGFESHNQEEFDEENSRNDIRQRRNFFSLTGEKADDGVCNHADTDRMSDRTRNRHGNQHKKDGERLSRIVKIELFQTAEHQKTDINQCRRSGGRRNNGSDRRKENAGEEQRW